MKTPARVALITGGDSGIGFGIAEKFAADGFRVAICGVDRKKGARAVARLQCAQQEAVYFIADVRQENQLRQLVWQMVRRFGRLDVLCNNAGIQKLATIENTPSSLWDDVMSVNARSFSLYPIRLT